MTDNTEGLIERLRKKAKVVSDISHLMAEEKSLRQTDNPEGRTDLYEWVELEDTDEWQAADELTRLKAAGNAVAAALGASRRVLLPVDMQFAQAESIDEPIPDETIVLHFMGSGASDYVTAKEYRAAHELAKNALTLWTKGSTDGQS